jgi:hypothetical protein
MCKKLGILLGLGLLAAPARGAESLLYLEAQGLAGYSGSIRQAIYYSQDPDDPMQKPSLGVDYLQRLTSEDGDWGLAALQARLAYDGMGTVQPQLYNAYLKGKFSFGDVWAGHDRPAFGLSSYLDTHGTLLQTLAMEGLGFDRDWGLGFYRPFEDGDLALSLTTGSGMPLIENGSYLADLRFSLGVLERDNLTVGLSLSRGSVLNIMGYDQMGNALIDRELAGLDAAFNWLNYEFKAEAAAGSQDGFFISGTLFRVGVNLLDENRLKLEIQPVYLTTQGQAEDLKIYSGATFVLNDFLTLRAMDAYDSLTHGNNIVGQVYFYRRLIL